jgi:hypothetical protein
LGVDALLRLGDERPQVTAADVRLHHNTALAIFTADLVETLHHIKPCHLTERDERGMLHGHHRRTDDG